MAISPEHLQLLERTKEVRVETGKGDSLQRTIIWVAVDDGDVFVRSVRGEAGHWYRRAVADPEVTLIVAEERIPLRAVPAADPASIERTSDAFRRKYPPSGSVDRMVRDEVLHTTLRLESR